MYPPFASRPFTRLNFRDAIDHAALAVPFANSTNSLRGSYNIANNCFEVWSYATVIGRYDYTSETWWVTDERYSVTTSRHTNALRAAVM